MKLDKKWLFVAIMSMTLSFLITIMIGKAFTKDREEEMHPPIQFFEQEEQKKAVSYADG